MIDTGNFYEQHVGRELQVVSVGEATGMPIDPYLIIRRLDLDGDREHCEECDAIPADQVLSIDMTPGLRAFLKALL